MHAGWLVYFGQYVHQERQWVEILITFDIFGTRQKWVWDMTQKSRDLKKLHAYPEGISLLNLHFDES